MAFIPYKNPYILPKDLQSLGLTQTTTPEGGTAYTNPQGALFTLQSGAGFQSVPQNIQQSYASQQQPVSQSALQPYPGDTVAGGPGTQKVYYNPNDQSKGFYTALAPQNTAQTGGVDYNKILSLFQNPNQDIYRQQQTENLQRLSNLEAQLAQSKIPSAELTSLQEQIRQQQRALNDLTPARYLASQPGLQNVGITQSFLERQVAKERDPIAYTLSNLLSSESVLSQEEERRRRAIQAQAELMQQQFTLQRELQQLSPKTGFQGLPEAFQGEVLKRFFFPQDYQSSEYKQFQETQQNPEFAKFLSGKTTGKDIQTTIDNLIQSYPDARIKPTDSLEIASQKAAKAPSFLKKVSGETVDYTQDIQTTASGQKYLDISRYTGKDREAASNAARKAGVNAVSKEQAEALQEIDNARFNQDYILNQFKTFLPLDATGRIVEGALKNKLQKYLQVSDYLAATGSLRAAAIQALRATAGSKGLRINQAEIALSVENDIPKITDTVSTAVQKFKNINALLDNAEKSITIKNRSLLRSGEIENKPISGTTSSGLKYKVIPQK